MFLLNSIWGLNLKYNDVEESAAQAALLVGSALGPTVADALPTTLFLFLRRKLSWAHENT